VHFYLYTVCVLTALVSALALIGLAFRSPPEEWEEWLAWWPVPVCGKRLLFTRVMRRRTGRGWEYRELTESEIRESDDDRADYQIW